MECPILNIYLTDDYQFFVEILNNTLGYIKSMDFHMDSESIRPKLKITFINSIAYEHYKNLIDTILPQVDVEATYG